MNNKLKELAIQANAYADVSGRWVNSVGMEKFAELIIKECVGVVEGGSFLHDEAPTAIFARECSSAIKRHFGVGE